jgi:hypothetical protein
MREKRRPWWSLTCHFWHHLDSLLAEITGKFCVPKISPNYLNIVYYAILTIASFPMASLGFFICVLHEKCFQKSNFSTISGKSEMKCVNSLDKFTLLTSNVCFLPECWARVNNLPNILDRARQLGKCFIETKGAELKVLN